MQPTDPFHGLFRAERGPAGARLAQPPSRPTTLPDPATGHHLRIATVELSRAICPSCSHPGDGGYVSFVSDLRLAFACPNCREFIWIAGA